MRNSRSAGFTILELVVVLMIVAMGAAIAVPAFLNWIEEDDLSTATSLVDGLFTLARDSAMRSGHPVTVVIDSASGLVWLDAHAPAALGTSDPGGGDGPDPSPSPPPSADAGGKQVGVFGVGEGESLELPRTVRIQLSRARGTFTFNPTGTAFADSLTLKGAREEVLITIDPWTGDAIVH